MSKFNGFAILSPFMKEKLPVGNKPCLQFEGIYQIPESQKEHTPQEVNKTIMYTWNVYRKRGADMLLEAFSQIEHPKYRLWIRGNGNLKRAIIEMSKTDLRIQYFEPMEREELLKMERRATLMVNPTPASWKFTKYFFPSKNMEYLASGTPTIMCRLSCLPKEYENYLYYFDNESVGGMASKMKEVCEKSKIELNAFGEQASLFIMNCKSPKSQVRKIMDLLK